MPLRKNDQSILVTAVPESSYHTNIVHVSVGIILNTKGELLLSYRPNFLPQGGYWEFPGGIVEDETNKEALIRELNEELDIQVLEATPFIHTSYKLGSVLIHLDAWLVQQYTGTAIGAEGQNIEWVAMNDMENFDMTRPNKVILRQFKKSSATQKITDSTPKKYSDLDITVEAWEDVRDEIAALNPSFAQAIDKDQPSKKFKLVKANYRFGDSIIQQGKFCLPSRDGSSINLHSHSVSSKLRKLLSFSTLPLGIILQGSTELCFENNHELISLLSHSPSDLIGLATSLGTNDIGLTTNLTNLYAGKRSVFMLPKISDRQAHSRLVKELNLHSGPPKNYLEHFQLFREISRSSIANQKKSPWQVTILFFTAPWFEQKDNAPILNNFYSYLRSCTEQYHLQLKHKLLLDTFWHFFMQQLHLKHKKPASHILDTVRHTLSIAMGISPGLSVVSDNTFAGPFENIQQVYTDIYQLKLAPTIMGAQSIHTTHPSRPVYHSIRLPMMLNSSPKSKITESLITDLVQIKSVLNDFYHMSLTGQLDIAGTQIEQALRRTRLDYFHSNHENNSYHQINGTHELHQDDPSLLIYPSTKDLKFSEMNSITRCCIRIMKKQRNRES